jgi:hypothetical protein
LVESKPLSQSGYLRTCWDLVMEFETKGWLESSFIGRLHLITATLLLSYFLHRRFPLQEERIEWRNCTSTDARKDLHSPAFSLSAHAPSRNNHSEASVSTGHRIKQYGLAIPVFFFLPGVASILRCRNVQINAWR